MHAADGLDLAGAALVQDQRGEADGPVDVALVQDVRDQTGERGGQTHAQHHEQHL